jgi:hypothetical protein
MEAIVCIQIAPSRSGKNPRLKTNAALANQRHWVRGFDRKPAIDWRSARKFRICKFHSGRVRGKALDLTLQHADFSSQVW